MAYGSQSIYSDGIPIQIGIPCPVADAPAEVNTVESIEKRKDLELGRLLNTGFDIVKSNLGLFVGVFVAAVLIPNIPTWIAVVIANNLPDGIAGIVKFLGQFVDVVLKMIFQLGIIIIALKLCDNQAAEFKDLFAGYKMVLNYFICSVVCGLIITVGLILFIVPGIMWAIQFQFASFLIVDQGCGPIEALQKSSELTRGHRMELFLLNLAQFGINLLGMICLLIGLFFTLPATFVASAAAYKQLKAGMSASEPASAT